MCFDIHKKHKKVKIATEDIVCYKKLERNMNNFHSQNGLSSTLQGVFTSPHYRYTYNFNKNVKFEQNVFGIFNSREINEGIHVYSESGSVRLCYDQDLFECIIPKGTKYYYNPDDQEYVSLCIIFKERLTFNTGDFRSNKKNNSIRTEYFYR